MNAWYRWQRQDIRQESGALSFFGRRISANLKLIHTGISPRHFRLLYLRQPAKHPSTASKLGREASGLSTRPSYSPFSCSRGFLSNPTPAMYLRSLPRAAQAASTCSSKHAISGMRSYQTTAARLAPSFSAAHHAPMTSQSQSRSAHAISNPTLAGIEKRWEGMPPQEQAELWMQLRDRMKVPWHEMTLQEKKAGMCTSTSWPRNAVLDCLVSASGVHVQQC